MRHGLSVPNLAEPGDLVGLAAAAEAGGWDGLFVWDHLLGGLGDPTPVSEPWTVLAAMATATSRLRLGTLVTPVPRRRPWVLARQVTTVDHLSGGRVVLGVGLGVPVDAEYGAVGEPTDRAGHARALDDGLAVIDALWAGGRVDHDGPVHRVHVPGFLPRPVQRPRPPVWVAATLPARGGVRRAARWDGVAPMVGVDHDVRPATPAEVADVVAEVAARRGSLDGFDVVVWTIDDDAGTQAAYAEAGATWLISGPAPGPDWVEDAAAMAAEGPPAA